MPIKKVLNVVAFCMLTAISNSSVANADILLNSGFELGSGSDAENWLETSGPAGSTSRSLLMPHTGEASAYMEIDHVNNAAAGAAYFVEQNQGANTIDNGLDYDLSFWAKADSADFTGVDMFVQVLWLDQDGSHGGGVKGELLTSLIGLGIDTSYQEFSLLGLNVADDADSFLLRFQLSAGAVDNIVNGLHIDDASLVAIPEPSTLGFLSIGGFLLFCQRRRPSR